MNGRNRSNPHTNEKRKQALSQWTASPDGLFRPQSAAACVSLSKINNVKEPASRLGFRPVCQPPNRSRRRARLEERGVY
jgi:hypothetical protein